MTSLLRKELRQLVPVALLIAVLVASNLAYVPLSERLAYRIEEAAQLVGLSPRAFRDHLLPTCPKLYAGRAIVIPRRLFEAFLESLAQEEAHLPTASELREAARR